MEDKDKVLNKVVTSYQVAANAGFYGGDPMNPSGLSGYGELGWISHLYLTYLTCIKPYINDQTAALEIGPGRGAWTKTFLPAREIWCLDVIAAEDNGFYDYVGRHDHVRYHQVHDFSCDVLPDDRFDFFFTYGCFCHLPMVAIEEYMRNVYAKMKTGAHSFLLIMDYDKYNAAMRMVNDHAAAIRNSSPRPLRPLSALYYALRGKRYKESPEHRDRDKRDQTEQASGRFHHVPVDKCCEMLKDAGYTVVERDMHVNLRDPMIHIVK